MLMQDVRDMWENALVSIELSISRPNFSTWFKNTHIVKIEDGTVYLGVPNQFAKDWLSQKYHSFILKTLRGLSDGVRSVEYIISKERKERPRAPQELAGALPIEEHFVSKSDNLNPRYTFDTFIIGPFNQLAHAAAKAVVERPGIAYNPLFIYGGTGHGKTHLTQAVGNHIKKASPQKKVFYVTSERFAVDFLNAVQEGRANSFKEKYRAYDVLIMDDIQFFAGKEKTQEELFHLFNTLYDNNKQIIFSSDKHPNFIPGLEDRLRSRFNAGMIADIPAPDHESRVAIIKAKAAHHNFVLPDEVAELVAKEVQGNIREIEGALNTLICQTQLKGRSLEGIEIRDIIKHSTRPKKNASVKDVVRIVAGFYNIDEQSIYAKTRRKEVVRPRQIIMYILREDFSISYPSIGEKMGGRDHTTVIHSCEKMKNEVKIDPQLSRDLDEIRGMLS